MRDKLRNFYWLLIGLALLPLLTPVQIGTVLAGIVKITIAFGMGYLASRAMHPYARPHTLLEQREYWAFAAVVLSRAIIVAAVVMGMASVMR